MKFFLKFNIINLDIFINKQKRRAMNRKDRLKLTNTPEKKTSTNFSRLNIYQKNFNKDEIHNIDEKNRIHFDDIKNIEQGYENSGGFDNSLEQDSLFDVQIEHQPSSTLKNIYKVSKKIIWKFFRYLHITIPYVFIIYLFFSNNKNDLNSTTKLKKLKSIVKILKDENNNLKKVEHLSNLCKIEKGTYIEVNLNFLYKYGIIGFRKTLDPNIIFKDGQNDCIAFKGSKCYFYINFSKTFLIDNFCIYHPQTSNMKSKMKKFKLTGYCKNIEKDFGEFEFTNANYQIFEFDKSYVDKIKVEILENYGFKKYTTLYKIFIFGV